MDSRASRCVQIADHVAYAVYRRYSAGDTNYLDIVLSRFDYDGGVLHGVGKTVLGVAGALAVVGLGEVALRKGVARMPRRLPATGGAWTRTHARSVGRAGSPGSGWRPGGPARC